MSLINQMLKDLEAHRNASKTDRSAPKLGISTSRKTHSLPSRRIFVLLALAILLIVAGVVFFGKKKQVHSVPVVVTDIKTEVKLTPVKQETDLQPTVADAIRFQNISVEPHDKTTLVNFQLNDVARYRLNHSEDNQKLFITFLGTALEKQLSVIKRSPAISFMVTRRFDEDFQVEIGLTPGAAIKKLQFLEKPQPVLQLELKNPQPQVSRQQAVAETEASVDKVALPMTPEQKAQQGYEETLRFLQDGGSATEAIKQLQSILMEQPKYRPARETLAVLFFKNGELTQANEVLMVGLQQYPSYLPFIQLQASILVKQGEISNALTILQSISPSIQDNPEYYAFIAALYQRQGQYMIAARLYDQLVKINPEQSAWWVGLGVSLEAVGKRNAALEAYQQALAGEALSPLVRAYVENKVSKLR